MTTLTDEQLAAIAARVAAYQAECQRFTFERRLEYVRAQTPLLENAPTDIAALLDTVRELQRYVTLVETLANATNDEPIRDLCEKWGVKPVEDRSTPPFAGRYYINVWATISELARKALVREGEGDGK